VFVGNLAFEASEEELRKHVESLGVRVESVRIVRDAKTNLGKGFGYVLLMSAAAAEVGAAEAEAQAEAQAVQLAISLINGSEIRQRSKRPPPPSANT
jgi:nucleolar protein 12